MKRSEINAIIRENKEMCRQGHFELPSWAEWTPADWATKGAECAEIKRNCMGWDITDFGSGDFAKIGLSLITLRNGNPEFDRKPYCEKIMMVRDGQVTPTHFHWNKMEDIIFRAGNGEFCMKLWNADPATEQLIEGGTVKLKVDGVITEFEAGKTYKIKKGQSVCYTPYIYHTFWAEGGSCLVGEVSMVNDDAGDNRFWEPVGRFPEIVEDEPAEALLCNEYPELA